MFTDRDDNFIQFQLHTTRSLGSEPIAENFVDLLLRYDGLYLPERWDTEDRARLRRSFEHSSRRDLIEAWTAKDDWKTLIFSRKQPSKIELSVDMKSFAGAKFDQVLGFIHQNHFRNSAQDETLLNFVIDISSLITVDYGFIAHTRQERRQSPALTPAERLPGIYWANLFGRPYIKFFGRDKLLSAPCYQVREIHRDLILLLTADSPNSDALIRNDAVVNEIKAYLNQNAFAGPNFPNEPCAVPEFQFKDKRRAPEVVAPISPEERLIQLRDDLVAKGYKVIDENSGKLVFQGADQSIISVDKVKAEISVDMTGQYLAGSHNELDLEQDL